MSVKPKQKQKRQQNQPTTALSKFCKVNWTYKKLLQQILITKQLGIGVCTALTLGSKVVCLGKVVKTGKIPLLRLLSLFSSSSSSAFLLPSAPSFCFFRCCSFSSASFSSLSASCKWDMQVKTEGWAKQQANSMVTAYQMDQSTLPIEKCQKHVLTNQWLCINKVKSGKETFLPDLMEEHMNRVDWSIKLTEYSISQQLIRKIQQITQLAIQPHTPLMYIYLCKDCVKNFLASLYFFSSSNWQSNYTPLSYMQRLCYLHLWTFQHLCTFLHPLPFSFALLPEAFAVAPLPVIGGKGVINSWEINCI